MNIFERLITGDFHRHEWKAVKEFRRSNKDRDTGEERVNAIIYVQECKICGERKKLEVD